MIFDSGIAPIYSLVHDEENVVKPQREMTFYSSVFLILKKSISFFMFYLPFLLTAAYNLGEGTHMLRHTMMCCPNGLFFHQKTLDMCPLLVKKILRRG